MPQRTVMDLINETVRSLRPAVVLPSSKDHKPDGGEYCDEGEYYQQFDRERNESDESDQHLEQGDHECDHS